jgi:hypothetical protein
MTTYRKTLALAALTAAGIGGTASAATIGQPVVSGPGERIPIDFAGYKEPASRQLPKNLRIVKRQVEVRRGERTSVVLTAPKGFRAVTIGMGGGHQIGGVVDDVNYPGKRSVRIKLWANANEVAKGETGKGTVYLLARRA